MAVRSFCLLSWRIDPYPFSTGSYFYSDLRNQRQVLKYSAGLFLTGLNLPDITYQSFNQHYSMKRLTALLVVLLLNSGASLDGRQTSQTEPGIKGGLNVADMSAEFWSDKGNQGK